ncbi:MAG TPA: hypothetical protein PKM65_00580 [Spirochaetota bacterium]|nr:hypothetical protein [Spirochaetota bacterium]HNT11687.1 hypothetical protein [Spirochaetota bacterium]
MIGTNHSHGTPILFIIFNRPETTRLVFERIRQAKPTRLFVSADGPRSSVPDEAERCREARAIVERIDWDCEVKTFFKDSNCGCRVMVSSAITWFFDNVEEGIILEDDCLPDMSFFPFCAELLERYRNDNRIYMISGNNFQFGVKRGTGSYYFSKTNHIWGWASWRRAWRQYDVTLASFPEFKRNNIIQNIFVKKKEQRQWMRNFQLVYNGKLNTWDHQWAYAILTNNGMSIMPNVNLVSNIGFATGATHTTAGGNIFADMKTEPIGEIIHPPFTVPDLEADNYERIIYRNAIPFTRKVRNKLSVLMER